MRKVLCTTVAVFSLASTQMSFAQAPQDGPEKVKLELDAKQLGLLYTAAMNLPKKDADPFLQFVQTQVNEQIAQYQKDHAPKPPEPAASSPPADKKVK